MPRRRRRGHFHFRDGEVRTYDATEFGAFIPDDRATWVWDLNYSAYYVMFQVGPHWLDLFPRQGNVSAQWVDTSVHGHPGHERLRMHLVAGSYQDHFGEWHPVCWCCEVLGAYVAL